MYYNKIQSIAPQSNFLTLDAQHHNVFYYSILYYDLLSDAGCWAKKQPFSIHWHPDVLRQKADND